MAIASIAPTGIETKEDLRLILPDLRLNRTYWN